MQWTVMLLALGVIVSMAVADCIAGRLTSGDFVLLQAYAFRLVLPLSTVAFILSQSAAALASVGDVLQLVADLPSGADAGWPCQKAMPVVIEQVSYSYGPGLRGLEDVTVEFPAGSHSVIVGANGSGKSTLAQLIAGSLSPAAGRVRVGGERPDQMSDAQRARLVLYVPQRASLFNRDLRANLLYPPANQGEEEALRWLENWSFHDGGRPVDPSLSVGEAGSALSGGQAQKLELARLMGVRVPCLILDESTSALDPRSEARIIADLRRAIGLTTTLIFVSHRVAMAETADQVIWMRAGRVAGVGGHADLLADEAYRALWGMGES
jgi:ABC-type bacteriocin/lantibiotic exporter with double-glycine peptidase domain